MPESKKRKKSTKAAALPKQQKHVSTENPSWLVPTMATLFIVGVLWILVYYISQAKFPVGSIGAWNLAAGFGFMIAGFILTTRWK